MSWTLTTLSGASFKAGVNRNTTLSGTDFYLISDMAEDTFCVDTRKDWVTDYANVSTHIKGAISDAVSDAIGIKLITADQSGFTSRAEAQTMLDVLDNNYNKIVRQLSVNKNKTFNE